MKCDISRCDISQSYNVWCTRASADGCVTIDSISQLASEQLAWVEQGQARSWRWNGEVRFLRSRKKSVHPYWRAANTGHKPLNVDRVVCRLRPTAYYAICSMTAWASAHRGKLGQLTPPWKNGWKIKKRKHAKKSSFLCLCYIFRANRAGRCREGRYAGHIFIQIYFTMHCFVVNFSQFSSPQAARGHWPPNQNPADVPGWRRL